MTHLRIVSLLFLTIFQADAVFAQSQQVVDDPAPQIANDPAQQTANDSARQISLDPALSENEIRQRANTGTVTVITGGVDGISNTYQQLAGDMAAALDEKGKLRVLPMVGYGSLQNMEDLLYLRGIDVGMVHSDIMRHLQQRGIMPNAQRKLRYVTKLYNEPLHLLVNASITDVQQLDGQTVIIGRPGSGNEMSALTLITELGIAPNLIHVGFDEGVEQVRSGEAAAMFVVTRRPSAKLREVTASTGLRFLPIPVTEDLAETYEAVNLTSEDYPNLISTGETIETPQMAAVLAVYDWQPGSSRYDNVTAFISSFMGKLPELRQASRKDVWEKLDLVAPAKGWERYGPANVLVEQLVAAQQKPAEPSDQAATKDEIFQQFMDFVRSSDPDRQLEEQEIRELYARFQLWQRAAQ